jgi:beta-glucosidase
LHFKTESAKQSKRKEVIFVRELITAIPNSTKGFYWGAATSAHQVEGNNHNDWTEWELKNSQIKSGRACDHYNRFREDFDIAKQLGHNAHRFSIEWSRIEPEEGKFDEKEIEHYRQVISALKERGIEPFVTLWHFTNPVWFAEKGGWLSKNAPKYFERYVYRLMRSLESVHYWITLNEPEIYADSSYLKGVWPPQNRNLLKYLKIFRNLAEAHKRAFVVIKKVNPDSKIGIAKNNTYFEGRLFILKDWWWNRYFLIMIKKYQDFIGLNYYFHRKFPKNENKETTDMGWEIYPEGIYHVLKDLKKYRKPIYITENGIADARDEKRAEFIKDHLKWVHKAIEEGVDVRGYFYWSLLDNFEWDKGFWPSFVLVEMYYETVERKIMSRA